VFRYAFNRPTPCQPSSPLYTPSRPVCSQASHLLSPFHDHVPGYYPWFEAKGWDRNEIGKFLTEGSLEEVVSEHMFVEAIIRYMLAGIGPESFDHARGHVEALSIGPFHRDRDSVVVLEVFANLISRLLYGEGEASQSCFVASPVASNQIVSFHRRRPTLPS
jgi:hypothetical protein